jgi:hypothetical protein
MGQKPKLLPETSAKIERCRILLTALEEMEKQPVKFDAFLDAFVDCARSITWVLQTEFRHKGLALEKWYAKEVIEMARPENNLLRFFTEMRNFTTKQGTSDVGTGTHIRRIFVKQVPAGWSFVITGKGEPVWIKDMGTDKELKIHASEYDSEIAMKHFVTRPEPPHPLLFHGQDFSQADALSLCKLYFGHIEDLVDRAETELNRVPQS